MRRNAEATCLSCPYAHFSDGYKQGHCGKNAITATLQQGGEITKDWWCGDHPDFELVEDCGQ